MGHAFQQQMKLLRSDYGKFGKTHPTVSYDDTSFSILDADTPWHNRSHPLLVCLHAVTAQYRLKGKASSIHMTFAGQKPAAALEALIGWIRASLHMAR